MFAQESLPPVVFEVNGRLGECLERNVTEGAVKVGGF